MRQDTKNPRNIVISTYPKCTSIEGFPIGAGDTLDRIKFGSLKESITDIRNGNKALKSKLPAVMFAKEFTENRNDFTRGSGLAILDFDKVGDVGAVKKELSKSKYILAVWVSPSGDGLKALVQIPIVESKKEYKEYYLAILDHYEKFNPDTKTSDITRLCFESYDPELYYNKDAKIFTKKYVVEIPSPSSTCSPSTLILTENEQGKIINRLFKWWVRDFGLIDGERNNNVFILACNFSEFGIPQHVTESQFETFVSSDFPLAEIRRTIQSAYKKTVFNSKSF